MMPLHRDGTQVTRETALPAVTEGVCPACEVPIPSHKVMVMDDVRIQRNPERGYPEPVPVGSVRYGICSGCGYGWSARSVPILEMTCVFVARITWLDLVGYHEELL